MNIRSILLFVYLTVKFYGRFPFELVSSEVCVVGGGDVVVGQTLLHVQVVGRHSLADEGVVVLVHQVSGESFKREIVLRPEHRIGFVPLDQHPDLLLGMRLHLSRLEELGEVGHGDDLALACVHPSAVAHYAGSSYCVEDFLLVARSLVKQIVRTVSSQQTYNFNNMLDSNTPFIFFIN